MSSFTTLNLADAKQCVFPSFPGEEGEKDLVVKGVQMEELPGLPGLARASKHDFECMLQAAWALVLRCYTGQDDVCFGYEKCDEENLKAEEIERKADRFAKSLVTVNLDDGAMLSEVHASVEKSPRHVLSESLPGRPVFNTMMMFNMRSQGGVSAGQSEHFFLKNFAREAGVSLVFAIALAIADYSS
jgi:hypothetical protein